MADHLPASDGDVRFQVYVKVETEGNEDFKAAFEFSGEPEEGVLLRCDRDLSETDEHRLENLAVQFVANVAEIVFEVQLAQGHNRPTWWR
jgi:hypothetical protein